MKFDIRVLGVDVTTKPTAKGGSYQEANVAYVDLSNNKTTAKKIMSFSNKDVFSIASTLNHGDIYTVESEKNEKTNYWDWVKLTRSNGEPKPAATTSSTAYSSPKSNYETSEERAKKQVYIVKQSSLERALETLAVGAKTPPKREEVIELAQYYVDWILGNESVKQDLFDLPNDIEVN